MPASSGDSSSSSTIISGLSVSSSISSWLSKLKGLNLLLGGILVTGTSGGGVVFLLDVKLGILLIFLLTPISDLLSSSGISSESRALSLDSLNLCLFLAPVTTTLDPVAPAGALVLVPTNLDLVLVLPPVVTGATVSAS